MSEKRVALTGTAPTWRYIPWQDPTLEIWCLNDAYLLEYPRASRWYDLHPFELFHFNDPKQPKLDGATIPAGTFVRPTGHLAWLAQQSIPVYLQKADPRVPRGLVFPRDEIVQKFGRAAASTPAWLLAHALLEGYTEVHIYGVHLATEWEYISQKPDLLWWCGYAAAKGVKIVTPKDSPLLRESHQYAYEMDPAVPVTAAQRALALRQRDVATAEAAAKQVPWWATIRRHAARMAVLTAQARVLDAKLAIEWETAQKRARVLA